ncbi:MAG TPA: tetratricopeptide repeat protein [Geobacteraceae bacterium]
MRNNSIIILLLSLVVTAVYWQTGNHEFINYDDYSYVTINDQVKAGLTWESIKWAFTSFDAANWHPLTWLSHMLDIELYGLDPRGHHLTSVVLHVINTALLFLLFNRMTGARWQSVGVAALFALHPMHVESVAWVAERKDVLSTLFWMLTLLAYAGYVARPGAARYLVTLLAFAAGLLAKPMLVTLPFVLLLLDYWPLGRFGTARPASTPGLQTCHLTEKTVPAFRLLLEKLPFLALTVASSIITYYAQNQSGAVNTLEIFPFVPRLENAIISYVSYLGKMFWPHNLAVFYPLFFPLPQWWVIGALLLLTAISVLVARGARCHPYLLTGWLWYLGTLVPVIGLMQVGGQAIADRYTYVPSIGLFIIIAWGVAELSDNWQYRQIILAVTATVVFFGLTVKTWQQLTYWQNSYTLFKHAASVTDNNFVAQSGIGNSLFEQGRHQEAIRYYSLSLTIKPKQANVQYNLGRALSELGNQDEAAQSFTHAIEISPDYPEAHYQLGLIFAKQGKSEKAIDHFNLVLEKYPSHPDAHYNLGVIYVRLNKRDQALPHFSETLRIMPDHAGAQRGLKICLDQKTEK